MIIEENSLLFPTEKTYRVEKSIIISIVQIPFIPHATNLDNVPSAFPDGLLGNWAIGLRGGRNELPFNELNINPEWYNSITTGLSSSYNKWYEQLLCSILSHPTLIKSDLILFPEYSMPIENEKIKKKIQELSQGKCIVGGIGLSKIDHDIYNRFFAFFFNFC